MTSTVSSAAASTEDETERKDNFSSQTLSLKNAHSERENVMKKLSHLIQSHWKSTTTDCILDEESAPTLFVSNETPLIRNLKGFVTIVQHLQLFFELLSIRTLSPQNRWKVITCIEMLKMCVRLYLLHYFHGRMLILPTEQEMKDDKRRRLAEETTYPTLQKMYYDHGRGPHPHGHFSPLSRPIRAELHRNKNHGDDTANMNTSDNHHERGEHTTAVSYSSQEQKEYYQQLKRRRLMSTLAEVLYIVRPVVYVFTYVHYGMDDNNWKPFYVSLSMDVASQLLHLSRQCSDRSKQELRRRRLYWVMYLLRAPFFHKFVKAPLDGVTDSLKARNSKIRFWLLATLVSILSALRDLYFNTSASNY